MTTLESSYAPSRGMLTVRAKDRFGLPHQDPRQSDGFVLCRILDILIASVAVVFFLPTMLVVGVLVKLQDGGPMLFKQDRVGLGGHMFKCWKFRSMVVDATARLDKLLASNPEARAEWEADRKLRNDPRITGLGRFIRKYSLDELPQLFNVLTGEMSLVGPRPIIPNEAEMYGHRLSEYERVKPGITGLWQVSGRNDVSYRRRVAMDVVFARNKSVALYIDILFRTIPAVLLKKGSY